MCPETHAIKKETTLHRGSQFSTCNRQLVCDQACASPAAFPHFHARSHHSGTLPTLRPLAAPTGWPTCERELARVKVGVASLPVPLFSLASEREAPGLRPLSTLAKRTKTHPCIRRALALRIRSS